MKTKSIVSLVLALGLSTFTAKAWNVSGVVSCPNGNTAAGIQVFITGLPPTTTSANGAYQLELPDTPATYILCINPATLPAGASVVGGDCTTFSVTANEPFASVDFTLEGSFCSQPPQLGPCWLTGGGTVFKTKGKPQFSFGGVVNPGCSPTAAGGGNWNVIDHFAGLHFKGTEITVVGCSGVPTRSPKVTLNVIDFVGVGTLSGVEGNPFPTTAVCFTARAVDSSEPGAGKDSLYLNVYDCTTGQTLLFISADQVTPTVVAPAPISTGNLQIHQTGCGK